MSLACLGRLHHGLGLAKKRRHVARPELVADPADLVQLPQVMGIAQRMDDVVGAVGLQPSWWAMPVI